MKKTGKAISVILPISLMLSSTPNPSALAETTLPTSSESYSFDTFSAVYNTATHILFINGTGELGADSFPTPLPWEEYKDEIRALILSDGVTSITTSIFSDLPGLTNVSLPASIDHIEKDAFLGCPGIQFLAFPGDYNELSKIITENGVTELLAPVAAALEAQLAESSTPAPLPSVTPATTKLVPSDERRISSYHDDDDSSDGSDGNRENEPEEPSDSEIPSDPEKTPAPSETTAPPKAPTPTPEVDYTKTDDQGRVTEGRETAEDGSVDKYTVSYDDEDETQTKTGTIKNTDGSVVKYTLYSRADGTPISRSDIVTYPDGGIDSFTTDYNETGIKSGLSGTYKKAGTTDKYTASFTDDGFLSEREGTLTNSDGTDKYTLTYGENESPVKREGALTRSDNTVDKYKVTYKENNTSERTGKIYNGETVIDDYTNTYNGSIISSSSGTRTENGTTNVYSISYDVNGKPSQEHNIFTDTDQSVDDYTITYTNGIISSRSGKKSSGSTVDDYEITYDGSKSVRTGSIATEALPYYEIIKDGETTISEEHYNKDNDDRKTTGWIIEDGEKDNYHYEYTDDSIIRGGERYPISDESNITSYTITTKGDTVTETTFNATSKQGTEIRTVGTVIVEENHYTNTSDGTTGYTITRNNGTVTREEYIIKTEGKTTTRTATQYAGEIKDDKSIKLQYSEVTERNDNNKITKITTTSTTPENEGQTTTTKSFASDGETIQSTCIEWRKDDDNYSIKNYGPEPDSKYLSGESHWKNDEYNWGTTTYGENETYLSGESHWKNDDGNYGEITYGAGGREERGSSHITTSDGVVSDETFSVVYHDDGTYIKNSTTNRTGYSDNTPKTEIYKETKNADGTITTEGHVVETTTIGQKNSDNTSAEHWYSSYTSTTVKNETGGTETTTNSRDLVSLTTTTQIIEKDADGNITKDHTTWEKNNGDNGNYYKNSDGQITNGYQEITTNGVLDKETYQIQYNEDGSSTRTADVTRQVNNDDGSTSTQTEHYTETTKTSSNGTMVVTKNANIWSGEGESKQSLGSYVLIDTTTPDGYHTIDRTDTNAAGMKTQNAETRDSQDNFVSAKRSYTDSEGNIVSTEYDSNWTETDRTWTDVIPEGTRTESYELTKDENNTITGRTGTVTINYEDGHSSTETYTISYTADNGQTRSGLVTTTNADGTKSIDDYYSTANEGGSVTSRTGTITSSTGAVITYTDTYKKHADGSYSTSHRSEEPNGVVFSTSITRNDQTGDSQSVISYIQTTNGYESGYTSYEIYTGSSGTFTKTVVTAVGNGSYYHETDGDENTREECGRDWKPTGWTDPSTNTDNSSTSNTVSPLSLTSPLNTLNPLSLEDSKLLALSPLMGLDGLELKEGQSEEELIGEGLEDGLDEDGNPRYISSDEALPAGEVEETEDSLNGEDENGENIEGNEDELSSTFFFKNAQISTKDQGFIKITKVGDNDVGDELQI
ncbi:MAG: leucine-rich repeat protein, partial [Clostridia bacterium]|nr:leucine-rich repeat protein [Clostridia bacterium]